jgi:four helix bundle protein
MLVKFDELKVLQVAEELADELWDIVIKWDEFLKNTIGQQLVRAVDSIGDNIAESYGRYHYGEKIQFLYYSRGRLFESKYWLNRANKRQLITPDVFDSIAKRLSTLVHQLNTFLKSIKGQRKGSKVREPSPIYETSTNSSNPFQELFENAALITEDNSDFFSRTSDLSNQPNQPNQANQPNQPIN